MYPCQIRIRIEHAIGLLKGRFQSLFELRIQVYTHDRHLWAIIWIRCCIILHNLILQVEAENFDPDWRDELRHTWDSREGAERRREQEERGRDDDNEDDDIQRARRQVMSEGQRFRRRVMNNLFNSPTSGAVRRT